MVLDGFVKKTKDAADAYAACAELAEGTRKLLLTKAAADAEDALAIREPAAADQCERMPNRCVVEAIDKCLQECVNLSLASFVARRPPRALTSSQRRELLPWVHPITGAESRRSVIFDIESGERWCEIGLNLIDGVRCRPTLHAAVDFGPIMYPAALWMYGDAQVRGTIMGDRWHFWMAELEVANSTAVLLLGRAQFGVEFNMFRKPFESDANFDKLKKCRIYFFENADHANPVFELLAESIAEGLKMEAPPITGDSWLRSAFNAAKARWKTISKCCEAKSDRWWAWEVRGDSHIPVRPLLLLVLVIYGFEKWWRHIDNCPLVLHERFLHTDVDMDADRAIASGDEEEAATDAPPEGGESIVKEGLSKGKAKTTLKEQREAVSNTMKFCAMSMAKPLNKRLLNALVELPRTVRHVFEEEQEMYRGGASSWAQQ